VQLLPFGLKHAPGPCCLLVVVTPVASGIAARLRPMRAAHPTGPARFLNCPGDSSEFSRVSLRRPRRLITASRPLAPPPVCELTMLLL